MRVSTDEYDCSMLGWAPKQFCESYVPFIVILSYFFGRLASLSRDNHWNICDCTLKLQLELLMLFGSDLQWYSKYLSAYYSSESLQEA